MKRRKHHDRTPTMHGAVVMYWLKKGRRWTTAQWAHSLGLTNQGMLRIFNVLESEHDFVIAQDEDRRWCLWEGGEPIKAKSRRMPRRRRWAFCQSRESIRIQRSTRRC